MVDIDSIVGAIERIQNFFTHLGGSKDLNDRSGSGARLLLSGSLNLFKDQAGDEFHFRRGMLDVIAGRPSIPANVQHDVFFDLEGAVRRLRTQLDIKAVSGFIIAGLHGTKSSSGNALWTVSPSDSNTTRK